MSGLIQFLKRFYFLYFKIPLKQLNYLDFGSFLKLNFPPIVFRKRKLMSLRVRGLKQPVYIRSHSLIDRSVLHYVLYRSYHLPPSDVSLPDAPVIVDLGSNIGLTMLDFNRHYPKARIYGYEMDQQNFRIAQKNCAAYPNLQVHHQAVWVEKKTLYYDAGKDADAFQISDQMEGETSHKVAVSADTIPGLLEKEGLGSVDYLKMDIEGAEIAIFQAKNLDWLDKIQALNLEIHEEALRNPQFILDILENKGFQCRMDSREDNAILAFRPL